MTLRNILFIYKHKKACKRLQRITDERRNSFETQDFAKRRDAIMPHVRAMRLCRRSGAVPAEPSCTVSGLRPPPAIARGAS